MGIFNKKGNSVLDVIRCDEPSYLIWKWHPNRSELGANNRENAIRWGSSLRVKEGSVAVFVYRQRDDTIQEFFEGPCDHILSTANLPVIASLIGKLYDGGTPFQAEVYFINLAQIVQVKFGVSYFDVFDPRFSDFSVPVAVRGTISFHIKDYKEFIKLHRMDSFCLNDFERQIRDAICRYMKNAITNAPVAYNIPVVQLETRIAQINDAIEPDISQRLREDFGVEVSGIDIGAIEIDKSSDEYAKLLAVTKDVTAATVQAQTTAAVKDIHDKQRIDAANYDETLRIQRDEAQYAQHKQTQTANFAAYQTELQAQVGVAGAEALGKMGANGAGSVDLGGGAGFNPAAMMAGMAMGGAVGQNVAKVMNSMMSGEAQPPAGTAPPPIPVNAYHVAVNGEPTGPFDLAALKQMISAGVLKKDSLVWKTGMPDWNPLGSVDELNTLFDVMPPVPGEKK